MLYLIKGLGRGGAERLLVDTVSHLDRSQFDPSVAFLIRGKDALVSELEAAGAEVRCLDSEMTRWPGRLASLVDALAIDLVHAHSPVSASVARVSLRGRVRFVYTEHSVWSGYRTATYWANAITFPRNDYVFAVSKEVLHSIRYPPGLRRRSMPHTEALYHGIDRDAVAGRAACDGVREEFAIPDDALLLGTIANLKYHKGHRHLLLALVAIQRSHPNIRCILAGVGPAEAEIRREVRRLGLTDTVIFAGFREDAVRIASALDVFVLPSEHEGLPIALLEAMSVGRPSVVTAVGGTPEVVEDGREAIVVPPADPSALAAGILRLLGDADLRRRLGERARGRAADFDIRTAVQRMEMVYKELLV